MRLEQNKHQRAASSRRFVLFVGIASLSVGWSMSDAIAQNATSNTRPATSSSKAIKKSSTSGWRYNAKKCRGALKKLTSRYDFESMGLSGTVDFLKPFTPHKKAKPKQTLTAFSLEHEETCRSYDMSLLYVVKKRATAPKYTASFIQYTRRPKWIESMYVGYKARPLTVTMTALYRGDFIVYEVDYVGVNRRAKRLLRNTILSCFAQSKESASLKSP